MRRAIALAVAAVLPFACTAPVSAQTAPVVASEALPGQGAAVAATSTVTSKTVKVPANATLCTDGTNLVVCPATSAVPKGPQASANSQSVTPASDSPAFPVGGAYSDLSTTLALGQKIILPTDNKGAPYFLLKDPFGTNAATVSPAYFGSPASVNTLGLNINAFNKLYTPGGYIPMPGDASGAYVVAKGSATLATGQISVGTTATLVRGADTGRTSITVIIGAANACAFGNSGVTLTTGYALPATVGVTDTTATSAALYGVCSATTTVSYKAVLP